MRFIKQFLDIFWGKLSHVWNPDCMKEGRCRNRFRVLEEVDIIRASYLTVKKTEWWTINEYTSGNLIDHLSGLDELANVSVLGSPTKHWLLFRLMEKEKRKQETSVKSGVSNIKKWGEIERGLVSPRQLLLYQADPIWTMRWPSSMPLESDETLRSMLRCTGYYSM